MASFRSNKLCFLIFFLCWFRLPAQVTFVTSSSSVCQGYSVLATVMVPPGTLVPASYVWTCTPAGNIVPVNSTNTQISVTFLSCGSASIWCNVFTSNNVLIGTYGGTVQVICSSVTVTPSSATICPGASATLAASGATSYVWSTGATSQSIIVSPGTNSVYTANTPGGTCAHVVNISIFNPTVTSSSASLCPGTQATLAVSGATNYNWFDSAGNLIAPGSPTVAVSPTLLPATYSLLSTWGGSCLSVRNLTLFPFQMIPNASVPASVCAGNSASLTSLSGGTFTWSSSTQSSAINPFVVTVNAPASYTLKVDSAGCSSNKVFTINLFPQPAISVTAPFTMICINQTAYITASGAVNYTWSAHPSLLSSLFGSSVMAQPTSLTVYTVTGANTQGCRSTSYFTIQVGIFPSLALTSSHSSVCPGFTSTLVASGAINYTWSASSITSAVIGPTVVGGAGTYTLVGSNGGSCRDSLTTTITAAPNLPLQITASSPGTCRRPDGFIEPVQFFVAGASNYTWTPFIPTQMTYSVGDNTSVTPSVTTCYTVTGTTAVCSGSASVCVVWGNCLGLDQINNDNFISLFPNPANGIVELESSTGILNIKIYSQGGALVWQLDGKIEAGKTKLDLGQLSSGLYTLSVKFRDGNSTQRKLVLK